MKTYILVLSIIIGMFVFAGCSKDGKPVGHKRDPAFFTPLVNPEKDFEQAEQKMGEIKVLSTKEIYNMRYALFDNGKFYYEVVNLGNGTGKWSFKDGKLHLLASRSMFDMEINVFARDESGEALSMQFLDRHGLNIANVNVSSRKTP